MNYEDFINIINENICILDFTKKYKLEKNVKTLK